SVRRLIDIIKSPDKVFSETIIVPFTLEERESVRDISKNNN
ncbi:TPA: LacI family transcriptional regulator, partial [Streptococcus agalactiae]|nr:LacI family transcriptional regulator [Streptococcus agalactiae]